MMMQNGSPTPVITPPPGAVPGGRVAAGADGLARLGGRVDVGHDDALTAQIERPPDIGRVRVAGPGRWGVAPASRIALVSPGRSCSVAPPCCRSTTT
jgi:hypothetical protein